MSLYEVPPHRPKDCLSTLMHECTIGGFYMYNNVRNILGLCILRVAKIYVQGSA